MLKLEYQVGAYNQITFLLELRILQKPIILHYFYYGWWKLGIRNWAFGKEWSNLASAIDKISTGDDISLQRLSNLLQIEIMLRKKRLFLAFWRRTAFKLSRSKTSSLPESISQVCWLNELWFKRYGQKCIYSYVLILIMTSQIW